MKDDIFRFLDFLWAEHRGALLGAAVGAFVAVLILLFGLLRVIFVSMFVAAGVRLGMEADSGNGTWAHRLRETKLSELFRLKRS